ncbi:MAG: right-handed parallel beta-helix repeat-containing protein [Candidatus Micrarchaeota archaeon]
MRPSIVLFAVLVLAGFCFSLNVSDCAVLDTPGETYVLNQSISGAPYVYYGGYYACILVNASNIILDCQGYTITPSGNTTPTAVDLNNVSGVTIRNCVVDGSGDVSSVGFSLEDADNNNFTNNTVYSAYAGAWGFYAPSGNRFADNTFRDSTYGFFSCCSGGACTFINNTAFNNTATAFTEDGSDDVFVGNNATLNGDGFEIRGSGVNMSNNVAYNNTNHGFHNALWAGGNENCTLADNSAYYNGGYGFAFVQTLYFSYNNNTAFGNGLGGFMLDDFVGEVFSFNNITNSTSCNNTGNGFDLLDTDNDFLYNNTACNNTGNGFYLYNTNYTNLTLNVAYDNGGDGFNINTGDTNLFQDNVAYSNLYGFYMIYLDYSSFTNNSAYDNSEGFGISSDTTACNFTNNRAYDNSGNGFGLTESSSSYLLNNSAYDNAGSGFYTNTISYTNFTNNTGRNNSASGFDLNGANDGNLTGNVAYNNSDSGFVLDSSSNNNLTNNTAYDHPAGSGFLLSYSEAYLQDNLATDNNVGFSFFGSANVIVSTNNTARDNTLEGFDVEDVNLVSYGSLAYNNDVGFSLVGDTYSSPQPYEFNLTGDRMYANTEDMAVTAQSPVDADLNFVNVLFGNDTGTLLTNMSLTYLISGIPGADFIFDYSPLPAAPPSGKTNFLDKFLNITHSDVFGSPDPFNSISFYWTDSELGGYNENWFELWKYNSTSGWANMNATLNTSANSLNITNMTPTSDYGILENSNCPVITSNGIYTQITSFTGAPNSASEMPQGGNACVKIASSDVLWDCNGYGIADNGTAGTTYGILLNGSLTNVTIRNCNLSNYTYGVYIYQSTDVLIDSNNATNFNENGFMLNQSSSSNLTRNRAFDGDDSGFHLETSTGNRLTDNTGYNNPEGFFLEDGSNNNYLANNIAFGNNQGGFVFVSGSDGNTAYNNTAYNNSGAGFLLLDSLSNNLTSNNASNNSLSASGFLIWNSNSSTLDSNLAFNNSASGVSVQASNLNNFTNNTLYNNSVGVSTTGSCTGNIFANNTVYANPGFNFYLNSISDYFISNNVSGGSQDGFYAVSCANNTFTGNTVYNHSIAGFQFGTCPGSNISNNTVYDNFGYGFLFQSSGNNTIVNNTVYNHTSISYGLGFWIQDSPDNQVTDNTIFDNAGNGIYVQRSDDTTLSDNNASDNGANGIYVHESNGNIIDPSVFCNNGQNGVLLNNSNYTLVEDTTACNNTQNGFYVANSIFNNLTNNTAYDNIDGFTVSTGSTDNLLRSNRAFGNSNGVRLNSSLTVGNSLMNNTLYNNSNSGVYVDGADDTRMIDDHLFNNGVDFHLSAGGGGSRVLDFSNVIFDNPLGNYANYTNLSLSETFSGADDFTMNWSASPPSMPDPLHISFAQKFVDITNNSAGYVLDSATWHWLNTEAAGHAESTFSLWKNNASGWTLLNDTPDVGTNNLSIANHDPGSVYAILEAVNCPVINASGTYTQPMNYAGSPNSANEVRFGLPAWACVKIVVSNVVWDCNGYNITGNQSTASTFYYGILLNGSITNVTVRNCPRISNYTHGVALYHNSNNATIQNVSTYNNSWRGISVWNSSNEIIHSCNAFNSTTGIDLEYAGDVRVQNSTARNNTVHGFYLDLSTGAHNLTNNTAYGNAQAGFGVFNTNDSFFVDDRAYLNGLQGFFFSNSPDNLISDSTAYLNSGEGFYVESISHRIQLTRPVAYSNVRGIYLTGSDSISVTGATVSNNTDNGLEAENLENLSVTSSVFRNNTLSGIRARDVHYSVVQSNNATLNQLTGIHFRDSTYVNITGNNASSNNEAGISLRESDFVRIIGNIASGNAIVDVGLNQSDNNLIDATNVSRSLYGFVFLESSYNNLTDSRADGFTDLADGGGNPDITTGGRAVYIVNGSNNNLVQGNMLYNASIFGINVDHSNGTVMRGNEIYDVIGDLFTIPGVGIGLADTDTTTLESNNIHDNIGGVVFDTTMINVLTGNNLTRNLWVGFYMEETGFSNLSANRISGSMSGMRHTISGMTIMRNDHFFNNSILDINISMPIVFPDAYLNLTNVVFDSPAGDFTNYTNLSLNDTLGLEDYTLHWIDNSTTLPLPVSATSFRQKFIAIEDPTGNASIDRIVWSWMDSELPTYTESNLRIYEYDGIWAITGASLDTGANTLAMDDVSGFSAFAILQYVPSGGGEEPSPGEEEELDVSIVPICGGFIVSVEKDGDPLENAFVEVYDVTHGGDLSTLYTNSSGEALYQICDIDVDVHAAKGGVEGTESGFAECGFCPECATDDDCADTEQCLDQQCVPVDCPNGKVVDHTCYECTEDSDCPLGQSCVDHTCRQVYECDLNDPADPADDNNDCGDDEYCDVPIGQPGGSCKDVSCDCGLIAGHACTEYECCLDSDCNPDEKCISHECVSGNLEGPDSGFVGANSTLNATQSGAACAFCDLLITDPLGKNMTGKTDAYGNFILPLALEGDYTVTLLKDGVPIKTIVVKSLPMTKPSEETPPTIFDVLAQNIIWLLILAAIVAALVLYWQRRKRGKKSSMPK